MKGLRYFMSRSKPTKVLQRTKFLIKLRIVGSAQGLEPGSPGSRPCALPTRLLPHPLHRQHGELEKVKVVPSSHWPCEEVTLSLLRSLALKYPFPGD